jgi:hypothetical protein
VSAPGELDNKEEARRLILFNEVVIGRFGGTDMDYVWGTCLHHLTEYRRKLWIFTEVKAKGKDLCDPQYQVLTGLVDGLYRPNKVNSFAFHVEHEVPEGDIELGVCRVVKFYSKGKWHTPKRGELFQPMWQLTVEKYGLPKK